MFFYVTFENENYAAKLTGFGFQEQSCKMNSCRNIMTVIAKCVKLPNVKKKLLTNAAFMAQLKSMLFNIEVVFFKYSRENSGGRGHYYRFRSKGHGNIKSSKSWRE